MTSAGSLAFAQQTGRAGGRGTAAAAAAAKPKTTWARVAVRDHDGASLDSVHIVLSGDATGEFSTAGAGTVVIPDLKAGMYRIRCEKEGFITLDREFLVQAGTPAVVEISLDPKPPAPPPPAPKPVEAPPLAPPGAAVNISITDFLDRNFISSRDPLKESVFACEPLETVRLLQMRDALAAHTHDAVDELLYVVAGEGTARLGQEMVALKPGTLVVVPRTTSHALERHGKNPLIVLSTLMGRPCAPASASK